MSEKVCNFAPALKEIKQQSLAQVVELVDTLL